MKNLKVTLYIPYFAYYHKGNFTETFKWVIEDTISEIVNNLMKEKQVAVLNDAIIYEAICNGATELQVLHDKIREVGYYELVEDTMYIGRDSYSYFDCDDDDETGGLDITALCEDSEPINYELQFIEDGEDRHLNTPYIEEHPNWTLQDFLDYIDDVPERNFVWDEMH